MEGNSNSNHIENNLNFNNKDYNPFMVVNSFNSNSNLSLADNFSQNINSQIYTFNEYTKSNRNSTQNKNSKRTIYDAIHEHIELDDYVWEIVDTVEFQRLRNLKQLGNCHFIFPGGTHSRFEHSIGVAYLSNKLISHLLKGVKENTPVFNINNSNRINEDFNIRAVTLAGLVHDLGHGPFSHLFDRKVIKALK